MRANFVMSSVGTGMRRNLSMTIALVLNTTIALSFVGASLLARTEISKFKQRYENLINVSIYLCPSKTPQPPCTQQTTAAQVAAIKTKLDNDPIVKSEKFINEDQAFQLIKAQQPESVAKFLEPGTFPASFTVHLYNVQRDYPKLVAEYGNGNLPGVGQVANAIDTINTLLNIIDGVRWLALVVALIVLIASLLLMANTIQVAAAQRRNETSIMRLVGASRWMTELPFMLETIISTAIGGLIATVGIWLGERYVLNSIFRGPTSRGVIPNLSINDVLVAGGIGLITGIVLSAITAFATLRLRVRL
jgi:cell division transport system permease protein